MEDKEIPKSELIGSFTDCILNPRIVPECQHVCWSDEHSIAHGLPSHRPVKHFTAESMLSPMVHIDCDSLRAVDDMPVLSRLMIPGNDGVLSV
jgi:hypothetical protein